MTSLERIASVLAVVPSLEAKIEHDDESTIVTIYSPCGKEARVYLRQGISADDFASQLGHAFLRLADLRQSALATQKGTT